ncbi:uncharacterized protein LOC104442580 [Eucalyptus grandis]|uniref:Uncharacterized protein n=2 Tax=Eucalyptus grandis TaxID=71139 RepID=A0ACC3L3E1_EUCGR|nr:uncharacterized protein LOC104442580 [Eucalyptus grandis]KAK3432874.1 hypothetical protein EUGRSUZ_D00380 [Eucalyptus grandis]
MSRFWGKGQWLKIEPQLLRIEALLAITAAILVFLGVFGSFRRCCSNRAFALVAFTAYSLFPAIIAYTLGLIQSAPFCSLHLPIWLAYLVIVLGSADSYTAHSIEDIEQWKSFSVDSAAKCFMASWIIASCVVGHSKKILCAVFLFVILFMKIDERARALMFASNSVMQKNSKLVVDYMSTLYERRDRKEDDATINPAKIDPTTMVGGCKYLVRVPKEAKVLSLFSTQICWPKPAQWEDGKAPRHRQKLLMTDEVITVEKVWQCKERLLDVSRGDPDNRLKDLCLSFSLFKFICLRFTGCSLPQGAHDNLRSLIKDILSERNGHERVFRLIEIELAFLFDLFYTKYPVNLSPCRLVCKFTLLAILVAAALYSLYLAIFFYGEWNWSEEERFAVLVTMLLMISILVVEFAQFGIMIFSEWAKVIYICKYVQSKWLQSNRCAVKLIEIMCRVSLLKPWGRQLHQYSLLQSYSYSPWKCTHNKLTAAYFDLKRNGQKKIAPTNLPDEVTEAISWSLRNKKEKESLRLNGLSKEELLSACHLETTTHVILVWHIATTFCEHEAPPTDSQLSQEQRNIATKQRIIATKLSRYLAYLVAFAPRLLPDQACRTEYIFDCAVSEARKIFPGSSVSMDDRIQELKNIDSVWNETIIGRGAQLGTQLVRENVDVWKVLADFWVEMMLYVAPSDDVAAHAKYLTTGGEFVTHVWVLVSHMGIIRDPCNGEQHNDLEGN